MANATEILNDEDIAVDTVYTMPARLFFGIDGLPDSVVISKSIAPKANSSGAATESWRGIDGYTPWHYSVIYVKKDNEPVTAEFGFEVDALEVGKGLNGFAFGANHVFFLGNEAKYEADTKAEIAAEVAKAKALIAANTDEAANFICVKLNRYIADAEKATTLKEMQNAYLSMVEMAKLIDTEALGIGAAFAQPFEAVKGVYTVSGLKVANSVDNLKPGLYIINGKKYVVK